jgi:hypothetical protein
MSRPRKPNKYYFTEEHESAIVEYAASDDRKRKEVLYITLIQPVLSELVDKIIFTYKFNTLPNIDSMKEECKVWLVTILDKFNPDKGYKAFSYFSVISKNWFTHKFKCNNKKRQKEVSYEENKDELEDSLVCNDNYPKLREEIEFWMFLAQEIEIWLNDDIDENEKKVLEAVKLLFENIDDLQLFSKKAVYFYLREITSLDTKKIVVCLNKMRVKYRDFKSMWNDGEV